MVRCTQIACGDTVQVKIGDLVEYKPYENEPPRSWGLVWDMSPCTIMGEALANIQWYDGWTTHSCPVRYLRVINEEEG